MYNEIEKSNNVELQKYTQNTKYKKIIQV